MKRHADAEALAELHTILPYASDTGDLGPLEDLHQKITCRDDVGPSTRFRVECELEAQRSQSREVAISSRVWANMAHRAAGAGLSAIDPTHMSIRSYHAQYVRRRGGPGDRARGTAMYEEEYRFRCAALGPDDPRTATAHANLALALRERDEPGDLALARAMLEKETLNRFRIYGANHPFSWIAQVIFAQTLVRMAEVAEDESERRDLAQEAADVAHALLDSRRRRYGDSHGSTLRAHLVHAHALLVLGRKESAIKELHAVQVAENSSAGNVDPGWTDLLLARCLRELHPNRAYFHARRGRASQAALYTAQSRQVEEADRLIAELVVEVDDARNAS
jgi:hypothetical protein